MKLRNLQIQEICLNKYIFTVMNKYIFTVMGCRFRLTKLPDGSFQVLVEEYGWGSITELSEKIGKSPEYISHRISLLKLPPVVLEMIRRNQIKPSTAQELVWIDDPEKQIEIAKLASDQKLTVREIRGLVKESKEALKVQKLEEDMKRKIRPSSFSE